MSSSVADQRKTHAERTDLSDKLMFESAVKLVVERGTEKTTLKDVGELAGYSRGLAGYRFGSKQGLFTFIIRNVSEIWLEELKTVTKDKTGYEAIAVATEAHYQFCKDAPRSLRAFYILWFESINQETEVTKVILGIHERRNSDVINWIKSGVEQGTINPNVDAKSVAGQFSASVIGIIYQWLIAPKAEENLLKLYENLKHTMYVLLIACPEKRLE